MKAFFLLLLTTGNLESKRDYQVVCKHEVLDHVSGSRQKAYSYIWEQRIKLINEDLFWLPWTLGQVSVQEEIRARIGAEKVELGAKIKECVER